MKTSPKYFFIVSVIILAFSAGCKEEPSVSLPESKALSAPRTMILFDNEWFFHRGDVTGAEKPEFQDSGWKKVDLPHDWSIEDIPGTDSPLDSTAIGGIDAGYFTGGTGWYRKLFYVPASLKDKTFIIIFEGIYMNSDVWLNGKHLGNHPYGYTSFFFDITREITPGKTNVLAVRVKNEGRNSRWYSGSGIYRHVWITIAEKVHYKEWSLAVSTDFIDSKNAMVNISAEVINNGYSGENFTATVRIIDPQGNNAGEAKQDINISRGEEKEVIWQVPVKDPQLWSPEKPALYKADAEIYEESADGTGSLVDINTTDFGIRFFRITPEEGFVLNGVPLKLKGGCVHHDNGPLGAAAFDRAEERRVELLKASGFNAIRCAHNPPSPAFLRACDKLGMLVIDEAFDMWREAKNPDDYHLWFDEWWKKDIESMVMRDRNHPSVIMWSIGNEVPERGKPEGAALAKEMVEYVKNLDPSRPVTAAVNSVTPDKDPYFAALDVCGYNYAVDKYVSDHKRLPERIMMGTESFPLEAFEYWKATIENPWVIGDFVWTSFDYLGEASIGWLGYPHEGSFYPWHLAFCGDIDICGFKRPQSYYRDALWGEDKTVSIFVKPPVPSFPVNPRKAPWSKWEWHDVVPSWNWDVYEGKPLTVEVYSNCDEVQLTLNGKPVGKKKSSQENKYITTWEVPYEPGVLTATGFDKRGAVATSELRTAGKPARIRLSADRNSIEAGGQDLSFVTVEIVDENGIINPVAENLVMFSVQGPGEILSVGSANPVSTESYKKPYRKAFMGKCLAIIRSGKDTGIVKLNAESEGLQGAEVEIKVY
ncbi:MAG TPA: glycoside hydrolase family 2 TIM barrel-domain containing protein [Bacteroidales bacterium]|nr:glycoside hydrolase family 2 TIM barrel-domain containing protein [Bacteroidales bacterium]